MTRAAHARHTWGLDRLFVAYAGYIYGSTSTDHIRYGATGRQRSDIGITIGILRAGAGYLSKFPLGCCPTATGRKPLIVGGLAYICRGQRHCRALSLNLGRILGRALQGSALCRRRHGAPV